MQLAPELNQTESWQWIIHQGKRRKFYKSFQLFEQSQCEGFINFDKSLQFFPSLSACYTMEYIYLHKYSHYESSTPEQYLISTASRCNLDIGPCSMKRRVHTEISKPLLTALQIVVSTLNLYYGRGGRGAGYEFWFCWQMILLMFGDWIVMEKQEGGLGAREYHRGSTQYLFIVYYCNVVYSPAHCHRS